METQFVKTFAKVLLLVCIAITIDAMEKEPHSLEVALKEKLSLNPMQKERPSLIFNITNQDTEEKSIFSIEYSQNNNEELLDTKINIRSGQSISIKPEDQYWVDKKNCNPYFDIALNNSHRTYMNSLVFFYSRSNASLKIKNMPRDNKSEEINEIIDVNSSYLVTLTIIKSRLEMQKLYSIREIASKN